MYELAKEMYESRQVVELGLRDGIERIQVGIIIGCDREGIVINNIDYRGMDAGFCYISLENVEEITNQGVYLDKIIDLIAMRERPVCSIRYPDDTNIKEAFFHWIREGHKLVSVIIDEEQILGYVQEVQDDTVVLEVIDEYSYKRNGYSLLSLAF